MSENISEKIAAISREVIADYGNNRAIDKTDDLFNQPDREVIFECLRNLMKVLYPGFYRDRHYKIYNLEHTVSSLIEDVLFHLSKQVYISFKYNPCAIESTSELLHARATEITLKFLRQIPKVRSYLSEDLQAAFAGDPAAFDLGEIILCYPGLFAISIYRLAHELHLLGVPLIPRVMTEYAHSRTGIDIHPGATIGHYFFIDHGTGIVVGESTVIGDNVKIYQGVTLGALSTHGGQNLRNKKRHPTIEDNVTIYSNASILGGETVIGHDAVIGGNAFVTTSVQPGARVLVRTEEMQLTDLRRAQKQDPDENAWYYII